MPDDAANGRWPLRGFSGGFGQVDGHHLIDAATGLPSETDLNLAAVVTAKAWVAEALAKAVILRGSADPFAGLVGTGAEALVVGSDGRVMATQGFASYLGGADLVAALVPPGP